MPTAAASVAVLTVTPAVSSSVIVRVRSDGFATECPPLDVPETVTDLSAASTELSTAVIVTVPVLVVEPAAIVRSLFVDSVAAPVAGLIDTVTVTAALDTEDSVAVTVLDPPFSAIVVSLSASVTVGVASSSVMVSGVEPSFKPVTAVLPVILTVSPVPSSIVS